MHTLWKWFHTPTPSFFDLLFSGTHLPPNHMAEHWIYLLFPCFTLFIIPVRGEVSSSLLQQIVSHPISSVVLFSNKRHSDFCALLMAAHTAIRGAPAVQRQGRASRGPSRHPTLATQTAAPTAAWRACMHALEVMLMGDFNYISLLPRLLSHWCCGYEPRANTGHSH